MLSITDWYEHEAPGFRNIHPEQYLVDENSLKIPASELPLVRHCRSNSGCSPCMYDTEALPRYPQPIP